MRNMLVIEDNPEMRILVEAALDEPFRLLLTVGKLGRSSIRYDYQVFNANDELAIEGTMTLVTLRNGKPTEIPDLLRVALSGETAETTETATGQ